MVNEAAVMVDNAYIKKAYKYDYFIQIDLCAINGLALKSLLEGNLKKDLRSKAKSPIADVFFRVTLSFNTYSSLTEMKMA